MGRHTTVVDPRPPVEVLVLGPVAVRRGARLALATAPRVAGLIGALALAGHRGLTTHGVSEALWPEDGASRDRSAVSVVVHRARRWLHGVAGETARIEFGGTAYALTGIGTDVQRFERLIDRAGDSHRDRAGDSPGGRAGDWAGDTAGDGAGGTAGGEAGDGAGDDLDRLAEALRLWRGEPLAGAPRGPAQDVAVRALARAQLAATTRYGRLLVAAGRAPEALDVLARFTVDHPLDEPLQAAFIEALAAAGRQAEALRTHERLRRRLAEELGIDPGPLVRAALTRVLRQELPRQRSAEPGVPDPAVPAQLPADLRTFVGREPQLARLDAMLAGDGATGPIVISTLDGTGGVGKTALAVHWAHRHRTRFPDGQLYLNLHGFGTLPPVNPEQALDRFLRALGVPGGRIPPDLPARAALFRSRLADRRMLVLLDNARDPEQVRPLLPAGPHCVAVVTSRNELRGLAVRDGAQSLAVDQMTVAEALSLLARHVGAKRVAADPGGAAALVDFCAGLPLALSIVADRAARQPDLPLAELAAQLSADRGRLDPLTVGDDRTSDVRAVFSWSYHGLEPDAARLFRLLGLHPGPDFDRAAAAALAGTGTEEAGRLLDTLAAGHLLEQRRPGRYEFHDLLRAYAAELAHGYDPGDERSTALGRLFDWFTHTAAAAARCLYPQSLFLTLPAPVLAPGHFDDLAPALAWLDAERANLVAVVRHAARHGPHPIAWQLADAVRRYLYVRMHRADGYAVAEAGLAAAEAAGDALGQASARLARAGQWARENRNADAIDEYRRALAAMRRAGWLQGEAASLVNLGLVLANSGRLPEAVGCYNEALERYREAGDVTRQISALANLGSAYSALGQLPLGAERAEQALALCRRVGNRTHAGIIMVDLGGIYHGLGLLDRAADLLREAIALNRELGDLVNELDGQCQLAAVEHDRGDDATAAALVDATLPAARDAGHLGVEGHTLVVAGDLHRSAGRRDAALATYREAIARGQTGGRPAVEVEALLRLAELHLATGDAQPAAEYAEQAAALARTCAYGILEGQALTALAAARQALRRPAEALSAARQAVRLLDSSGHRAAQARAAAVLADLRHPVP
ncbi:AfsR/SARP family transcriptional regulator [Rugosimonospora africana]|nr:BTAD domain-containing putative transcriptional regulator [Rugosimonospora africana]